MTIVTKSSGRSFHRIELGSELEDNGPVTDKDGDIEMGDERPPDPESDEANNASHDGPTESQEASDRDRLIIAIDFGTTFSCVAYTRVPQGVHSNQLDLDDIRCIDRYPDYRPPAALPDDREDVPTELWYEQEVDATFEFEDTPPAEEEMTMNDPYWDSTYSASDEEQIQAEVAASTEQMEQEKDPSGMRRPRCWGFGVQNRLKERDIPKDDARRIARFKLLLDQSEKTQDVRNDLAPMIKSLKRKKLLNKETDLFVHYLTHLLENVKEQLVVLEELGNDTLVEFVLCVPAKWPSKGCRVMQTAMKQAVEEVGLNQYTKDGIGNLFIVSEPEAAAACVIAEQSDDVYPEEVVVVLDAGGGTVDAATYGVTKKTPLRLHSEIVEPDSELCGASYINERFGKLLSLRLQHEDYLVRDGKTIKSIVEALVMFFENDDKRKINTNEPNARLAPIWIDGLRLDPKKRFHQNRLETSHGELNKIFERSLRGTRTVLDRQLQWAKEREKSVNKVILTGGFGESSSLRGYLEKFLKEERNFSGARIDLLVSDSPSTAVARGAVLRALDKDHGPERISQCSYGFLITEPHEPEIYEAHRRTKCRVEKSDGEKYVPQTIHWLIKKGDQIGRQKQVPIEVKHTFHLPTKNFICREALYVSDQRLESHYRRTHVNNKDAELAGTIVADMTFLRNEGLIQPVKPSEFSQNWNKPRKEYWAVQFELVMIVEGRNLRYEARWPLKRDLKEGQQQDIRAKGQTCIAAAFQPGTA